MPVSALNVTGMFGRAEFDVDNAVTVMEAEFELSDLMEVGVAESESEVAVEVVAVVPVVTAFPPQPESKVIESKRANMELERHKEMVRTETLLIDGLISPYCENV